MSRGDKCTSPVYLQFGMPGVCCHSNYIITCTYSVLILRVDSNVAAGEIIRVHVYSAVVLFQCSLSSYVVAIFMVDLSKHQCFPN